MNIVKKLSALGVGISMLLGSGCASMQNVYPITTIEAPMERSDYCILETVKGSSESRSYVFGLFKVINNKAIKNTQDQKNAVVMDTQFSQFLGISEEPTRYTFFSKPQPANVLGIPLPFTSKPSGEDRAYFNALSVLPEEADAVLNKSYYKEVIRNIPFIYRHEFTEFKGKAIRLKSDLDLRNQVSCIDIKKSAV